MADMFWLDLDVCTTVDEALERLKLANGILKGHECTGKIVDYTTGDMKVAVLGRSTDVYPVMENLRDSGFLVDEFDV